MSMAKEYVERTYHIEFDTVSNPPYIRTIKIKLSNDLMTVDEVISIALIDDPLYKALERYVRNNPSHKRKVK